MKNIIEPMLGEIEMNIKMNIPAEGVPPSQPDGAADRGARWGRGRWGSRDHMGAGEQGANGRRALGARFGGWGSRGLNGWVGGVEGQMGWWGRGAGSDGGRDGRAGARWRQGAHGWSGGQIWAGGIWQMKADGE